jgi:hypothetical protein
MMSKAISTLSMTSLAKNWTKLSIKCRIKKPTLILIEWSLSILEQIFVDGPIRAELHDQIVIVTFAERVVIFGYDMLGVTVLAQLFQDRRFMQRIWSSVFLVACQQLASLDGNRFLQTQHFLALEDFTKAAFVDRIAEFVLTRLKVNK